MSEDQAKLRCTRCQGAGHLPFAEPECNGGALSGPCERCGGAGYTVSAQPAAGGMRQPSAEEWAAVLAEVGDVPEVAGVPMAPAGAKVISLEAAQRARGGDDARFLACPACGGEDWAVVCRFASGRPFIAGLVCAACEPEAQSGGLGVVNGFLADG